MQMSLPRPGVRGDYCHFSKVKNRSRGIAERSVLSALRLPGAFRITMDIEWYDDATQAYEWFFGRNALGVSMYDKATGCRDGLHIDPLNENQGAEFALSLVQAMLEMKQFARECQDQLRVNEKR